jgi:hypothetical protein
VTSVPDTDIAVVGETPASGEHDGSVAEVGRELDRLAG